MKHTRASRMVVPIEVAALLTVILTGCQVPAAGSHASEEFAGSAAAVPATPEATPPSARVPLLSDLAPGTVIATGEFDDRGVTGQIRVTANGDDHGFDVTLTGIHPVPATGTSLEFNALPSTASEADLQEGFSYYTYIPLAQAPDQTVSIPNAGYGGFETNDPRYMRTAIIWAAPPEAPIGLGSIVATAALTWNLPNMEPGPEAADHGPADGARGKVVLAEDGTPMSYRIAWGDTADGIAARFGITPKDLIWLNPDRAGGRLILADITINLSRESRGLRW